MKIAINGDQIVVADAGPHYQTLKSMGLVWNPRKKIMTAGVNMEIVERLCKAFPMPQEMLQLRDQLRTQQAAIDAERMAEKPVPLVDYPVRAKMFAHQIRGANMALLAFGIVGREVNT